MNTASLQKLKGVLIPNVFGIAVLILSKYFIVFRENGGFIFSEFVVVPMLMGLISAWFWRRLLLRGRSVAGYLVYSWLLALLLSYLCLGEGAICLIIVSPLIYCFMIAGVFIGKFTFKRKNDTLSISIVVVLVLIFATDAHSTHSYQNEVSDTMTINAPVSKVWQNVVAFKRIQKKNTYWLFKIGMPSPIESTVEARRVGAGRKCIFSNGYVFGERIAVYDSLKNLTFDVIDQPRDPEIMNHIDILRGQFLLKDNGNGTTTLVGNSWYKLYVFPSWYYDIWARSVTRNVHLRVMEHIKEISESN